jgi:hypothetical protein
VKPKEKSKSKGAEAEAEAGVGAKGYSDKDLEKLDKNTPITLKKKTSLAPVKLPESGAVAVEPGAAAAIIQKSKLGMKETSKKLSSEKASAAAVSAVSVASEESEKLKEKKKSSKLGSLKLNPASIVSSLEKSKKDGE